ncbi:hypothetical protein INT43_006886 [Umbelopsis isabellina]|uniref:Uncharacterized protein n=1 Tax=Mortierella isabellina TaxID=91625 RepID=A0A8H7PXJ8_MORIS|nr:hypothetical protein INT43_006886 [Umbelopsis isabellina]
MPAGNKLTSKSASIATLSAPDEREAKRISNAIDRRLAAERAALAKDRTAKLLILGAGESGKTTVLKQIKIIHGDGFTSERVDYRRIIRLNALTAIRELCIAMVQHRVALAFSINQEHLDYLLSLDGTVESTYMNGKKVNNLIRKRQSTDDISADTIFDQAASSIKAVWSDPAAQEVFQRGLAKSMQDSSAMFLDEIDRLAAPRYTPTDADILRARVRTFGVTEHEFKIDQVTYKHINKLNVEYLMWEVRGHKDKAGCKCIYIFGKCGVGAQDRFLSTLVKAPYFDDCSAIIFVAAISSFDQYLREDPSVNRLYDALQLFETICNHRLLRSTSVVLFLNKIDVLQRKLASGTRLSHYFRDYTGMSLFWKACDSIVTH